MSCPPSPGVPPEAPSFTTPKDALVSGNIKQDDSTKASRDDMQPSGRPVRQRNQPIRLGNFVPNLSMKYRLPRADKPNQGLSSTPGHNANHTKPDEAAKKGRVGRAGTQIPPQVDPVGADIDPPDDSIYHDPNFDLPLRPEAPNPFSGRNEADFKPGTKEPPRNVADGIQAYAATLLRVQELQRGGVRKTNQWIKRRTWCGCGGADDGRTMIKCEDPNCKFQWWHLSCLEDAEYNLAQEYEMWVCEGCWRKRCVEYFKYNPEVLAGGIGGLENHLDGAEIAKTIFRVVDKSLAQRKQMEKSQPDLATSKPPRQENPNRPLPPLHQVAVEDSPSPIHDANDGVTNGLRRLSVAALADYDHTEDSRGGSVGLMDTILTFPASIVSSLTSVSSLESAFNQRVQQDTEMTDAFP